MPVRISLCLALLLLWSGARAQPPLNDLPPLASAKTAAPTAGRGVLEMQAAERALELGFASAAEAIYRQRLQRPEADRGAVTLGLATALLDQGRAPEAEKVLDAYDGPRGAAWHLRRGLAAVQQGFVTTAKNERDASRINELPPGDRGWHLFLQGSIATAENEHGKAAVLFNQAMDAAASGQARARFLLKREQERLRSGGPVTDGQIETTRRSFEQYQGRKVGYDLARTLATMLDTAGKKDEAVRVLQRELAGLPAEEREEMDEMRLLLGLIDGAMEGAGRNALERLVERGSNRDEQRVALQLLARASTRNPQLAEFRRELDQLIAATPAHPILEDLLLFRAQAALATKTSEGYARAEDDVRTLLQTFPGSPLKLQAYGVLTESAWEQLRFRTAADNAAKLRELLPPGPEHAALSVLVAEAWFRARDFRSAADAYAAALAERPPGVAPGELLFQRVLAEIEAGTPEAAAAMLDELERDPALDMENRWQAEWNLARALLAKGRTAEALARVNRLLTADTEGGAKLSPELRARMVWMQARLSAASGRPEQTLKLVDGFPAALDGVPAALRDEIASSGALLRAEANFALGRDQEALAILQKLRADFPKSDAAVYSYFDEAEFNVRQDKTVEAQQNLTEVGHAFPEHPLAPFALFQAALQAERRGQDANLVQANQLIEDMLGLVEKYPHAESEQLVFAARMKQGDIFRERNDFPSAQRAYEELVNKFSQRSDAGLAQLALAQLELAKTHNAQSASQPSHAESALVLFEHVRDSVKAPLDARVEAGFNLGFMHERRNEPEKAETVWWRDVVDAFLLKPDQAAKLGAQGRYWMARTLFELGSLYEQQEKLEQAKDAWLLILRSRLGTGEALAKARLARFNLPEAKP